MRHFFANTDGLPKPVQICSRIAGLPRNLGVALQKCKLPRQDAMRLVGGVGRTMDRLPANSCVRIWTWYSREPYWTQSFLLFHRPSNSLPQFGYWYGVLFCCVSHHAAH